MPPDHRIRYAADHRREFLKAIRIAAPNKALEKLMADQVRAALSGRLILVAFATPFILIVVGSIVRVLLG